MIFAQALCNLLFVVYSVVMCAWIRVSWEVNPSSKRCRAKKLQPVGHSMEEGQGGKFRAFVHTSTRYKRLFCVPFKIMSIWMKARKQDRPENVLFNHLLQLAYHLPVMNAWSVPTANCSVAFLTSVDAHTALGGTGCSNTNLSCEEKILFGPRVRGR